MERLPREKMGGLLMVEDNMEKTVLPPTTDSPTVARMLVC